MSTIFAEAGVERRNLHEYDYTSVIVAGRENKEDEVDVAVIGIDADFAQTIYNSFVELVEERSTIDTDDSKLAMQGDMEGEDQRVIEHVARFCEQLLAGDQDLFDGGLTYMQCQAIQYAFSVALVTSYLRLGVSSTEVKSKTFKTTIGSFIDSFDGCTEFTAFSVPAATPRIVTVEHLARLTDGALSGVEGSPCYLVIPRPIR